MENILVCGVPGVGKTTLCEGLLEVLEGYGHLEVSKLIKEEELYEEWDDERECSVYDSEKVGERLEEILSEGKWIVDFHSAECMEGDWFKLVVLLHCDTKTIWTRLENRKYKESKIRENVEAEIFGVIKEEILLELLSSGAEEQTHSRFLELSNDDFDQMSQNLHIIAQRLSGQRTSSRI